MAIKVLSGRFIETIIIVLLLLLWILGARSALKSEYSILTSSPESLKKSFNDKNLATVGPLYLLAKKTLASISTDDKVYFFNPAKGDRGTYYYLKLQYYLAPRHVAEYKDPDELRRETILSYDYLLYYIPKGLDPRYIEDILKGYPFLKPLSRDLVDDGFQAVFKVGEEGG